jgi:hypothetical protein
VLLPDGAADLKSVLADVTSIIFFVLQRVGEAEHEDLKYIICLSHRRSLVQP